jgi:TRAP-type C4-dicarboxylate transport system permease small subunit
LKVLDSLSRWMGYVSSAIIIVLMLLVTADVCGRYFFNKPIMGASELARFMMIIIVFPALAWTALAGKHIKVDILIERFPQRFRTILNSIMLLAGLVIYGIITWQSALYSMKVDNITSMLRLPQSIFYWIMTVGCTVFCLSIMALIIRNIAGAVKR